MPGGKNGHEPNEGSVSSNMKVLDDSLTRTYEPIASFGPNVVLQARPTGNS